MSKTECQNSNKFRLFAGLGPPRRAPGAERFGQRRVAERTLRSALHLPLPYQGRVRNSQNSNFRLFEPLQAPAGKRVQLRVKTVFGACSDGCFYGGTELKARDLLRVGSRFGIFRLLDFVRPLSEFVAAPTFGPWAFCTPPESWRWSACSVSTSSKALRWSSARFRRNASLLKGWRNMRRRRRKRQEG